MLQNIKPRGYQEAILQTALKHNTLVVLPTGIGKTLIALMLSIERQKQFAGKILFLAPTRPLAMQHLEYFKKHLPGLYGDMQLFTGKVNAGKRKEIWQKADLVFSTPQCVANDLRNSLYSLEDVVLLIEDESHRCLKSYDYVYVADVYIKQARNQRILGLTASPGSEMSVIKDICNNLHIDAVEARTRESDDVKSYLQELKTRIIRVELPEAFKDIRKNFEDIFGRKIEELKNRKLLFQPPTKKNLLELQGRIMRAIGSGNKHFNLLKGASVGAQAIKIQHALELIETQGIASLHNYLQDLFGQAEQKKSRAAVQLVQQAEFSRAYIQTTELLARNIEHPKLSALKEIVENDMKENGKARIIVFSQYRDTITTICRELNKIDGVNAKVFIGQARRDEGGLTQKEQQGIIKEFKEGKINILVASSIGEEGLDLPEVNAVIFYEPVPSAIRKIQRQGRTARLMPGKLVILITRKTRDESYHYASLAKERKMHGILRDLSENFRKKSSKNIRQKGINEFV
ncbi:DEAD/DEAH box helicase [Candidatus Pacearchaeota archaeon]|nr:DEAD/DEAH box helicase [Candidatus Pacearchaeota archaeon]